MYRQSWFRLLFTRFNPFDFGFDLFSYSCWYEVVDVGPGNDLECVALDVEVGEVGD